MIRQTIRPVALITQIVRHVAVNKNKSSSNRAAFFTSGMWCEVAPEACDCKRPNDTRSGCGKGGYNRSNRN